MAAISRGFRFFNPRVFAKIFWPAAWSVSYWLINDKYLAQFKNWKIRGAKNVFSRTPEPTGFISDEPQMTSNLNRLVDYVRSKINVDETVKDVIDVEVSSSIIEPVTLGSGQFGASFVILPDYFNATDIRQLRASKLNALLQAIYEMELTNEEWSTTAGKLLIDSFILPEEAKKYAIAKAMYAADNNDLQTECFVVVLAVLAFGMIRDFCIGKYAKKRAPMNPFMANSIALAIVALYSLLLRTINRLQLQSFSMGKTITNGKFDGKFLSDDGSGHSVDEEFYAGATAYNDKIIQRNLSLRNILQQRSGVSNYFKAKKFRDDGSYSRHTFSLESPPQSLELLHKYKNGYSVPIHMRNKLFAPIKKDQEVDKTDS